MSYTLRDLPLPVKVVASVFLMAVGLGYTSAMVQLHMQDSKSGKPMPTVGDVILKYTGKKWFETDPPRPVSKLERLVMGSTDANAVFNGAGSMGPAFFSKDPSSGSKRYSRLVAASPTKKAEIDAQREGERQVVKAWLNADPEQRRAAYEADSFAPPAGEGPKAIDDDWKAGAAFKVKSIIDARCVACHGRGGPQENFPLETYEQLTQEKYISAPAVSAVPPGGGYVRIEEPMSLDKLTQTTHTHLLSFAMLFSLTGVIFAFSSYPTAVRLVFGPWVTVAVTADVSLWWLARLSDQWGPYFAMGIIATGGAAGVGLGVQITLGLFNMYGPKGKAVVAALFLLGGAAGALVIVSKIKPGLDAKGSTAEKPPVQLPPPPKPGGNDDKNGKVVPPYRPVHDFDRLLTLPVLDEHGKPLPPDQVQWNGTEKGSMALAFFERDKAFKKLVDDPAALQEVKDKLRAERQAELESLVAWGRAAEAPRTAAYTGNGFEVPPALAGKVSPEFVADGKVKVRSLIDARCVICHGPGGKQEDYPLDTYAGLSKYLTPFAPPAAPAPPVAVPPKPVDPIPAAKDD